MGFKCSVYLETCFLQTFAPTVLVLVLSSTLSKPLFSAIASMPHIGRWGMVAGDGHERSEVYVYFIWLQVIVLAVLHHLRIDAAGIVGYHLGGRYYRDAICSFSSLFFRPEKHFSIVYSTYEDIFVCGKSMQGGLDFGVFGVGICSSHQGWAVSHQENDVFLFGQFVSCSGCKAPVPLRPYHHPVESRLAPFSTSMCGYQSIIKFFFDIGIH